MLFTDDYSRFSWVSFLKFKLETFKNFKKFKAFIESQSGKKLKALRTDRGGEFLSNEFIVFCDENGIHKQLTAPYTPKQKGFAERKNRTMVEMARRLLKAQGFIKLFCGEAVATVVNHLNISPAKAVSNKTPHNSLKRWKKRAIYLWLILPLLMCQTVFGLSIVDAPITCLVRSHYFEILMRRRKVKSGLEITASSRGRKRYSCHQNYPG